MHFENRPLEDLIHIAAAGGGFRIDARHWTVQNLIRIAAAASGQGPRVIISGVGNLTVENLIHIGAAGHGAVMFEDE
jgi:hypothetical protein